MPLDLTVHPQALERAVQRARERGVIVPTFAQQRDPALIPASIVSRLRGVGLWDLDPLNLFRITWHNQPVERGGGYGPVNVIEFPSPLTGVEARIVALVGNWFPTGAHKVGAAYGCLVPRLVTGQFDPTAQKAVWPSTGNYCRGGAYDGALLGCDSIAILPEGMSQERFAWLDTVAGEVIKTAGSESNVKAVFDKCRELVASGQDLVIFNQFDDLGNYLWHHQVTGPAIESALGAIMRPGDRFRGLVAAAGSGGTLASGDYLKGRYPGAKIAISEALQCPTLLQGGFGVHRIEGIGDRHIPWIVNARNADMVMAVDDETAISLIRLFNEPAGKAYLATLGVAESLVDQLSLLGISGVHNLVSAIKFARYYELDGQDIVLTVLTDSMALYGSRLRELTSARGEFTRMDAAATYARHLQGLTIDHMEELTYYGRKRIHNLKYYTWVEQLGKAQEELDEQWASPDYWESIPAQVDEIDALIQEFNARTGLVAG